ncbi:MAG: Crp/Fnr family transcriptional regulator [Thermodesulfobacteriota bacterium]
MEKTKLWYISSNKIFSGLPEKERDRMAPMLKPVNIKKKSFIYSMGDSADDLYILKEGRIKITRITEDGKELTFDILEPGDIFGELALAGEEERETSAEALEDSFICTINRKDFEGFVGKNPALSLRITKWIGSRLRKIENRVENLIFQDVRTRILALFIDLGEKYGKDSPRGRKIDIKLSHQEIANLVGATRETVTLELNNLKKTGEILTEGKEFVLPSRRPPRKT